MGKRRTFGNITWMRGGYRIRWPIPGTDRRGQESGFPTMDLAEARLAQIRLELANEKVFGAKAKVEPIRIADYAPIYTEKLRSRGVCEATIRMHDSSIRAANRHIGDRYMHQVSREDALRYRERFRVGARGPVCNRSVNHRVTRLAVLYQGAIEDHHATENPFRGLRLLRTTDKAVPWLGYEKRLRYLNALHPDMRFVAEFLLETGMRQSEMFRMRKDDYYPDRGRVLIPKAKNGKPRWVALTNRARTILETQIESTDAEVSFVWPWRHRGDGFGYLWLKSRRRLEALGMEPLWPHAWRHTCATTHSQGGASIQEVARVIGTTAKTAERYRDHSPDSWEDRGVARLERMRRESEGEAGTG